MSILKILALYFFDFVRSFFFKKLNDKEFSGQVSRSMKTRLIKHTRLSLPFSLGRTIRGLSFDNNISKDPYGRLCKSISNGENYQNIFAVLQDTLNIEKNLSAAEIVNLNDNIYLKKFPAWAIVMPWEKITIKEKFNAYPKNFYQNRSNKGLMIENTSRISIINLMYSTKSLENKIKQMEKLFISINNRGLIKNNDLPKVNILIDKNEWRWFMGYSGNHRSYVLSCLNYKMLDARIESVIFKNDILNWYNVKNGTYSLNEAEIIFDSYFNGENVLRGII